jgi:hypothetical protein
MFGLASATGVASMWDAATIGKVRAASSALFHRFIKPRQNLLFSSRPTTWRS